jgi:hypothetical protein
MKDSWMTWEHTKLWKIIVRCTGWKIDEHGASEQVEDTVMSKLGPLLDEHLKWRELGPEYLVALSTTYYHLRTHFAEIFGELYAAQVDEEETTAAASVGVTTDPHTARRFAKALARELLDRAKGNRSEDAVKYAIELTGINAVEGTVTSGTEEPTTTAGWTG